MENEIIAKFYADHSNGLKAYFIACTANKALSEDMTQDVFMKLLNYKEMITEQTLPNLAYTLARRLLTDFFRHRHAVDKCEHMLMTDNATNSDPHTVYSANELTEILEQGIKTLPEQCQDIYRLHVYEGMKISGISKQTHIRYKVVEYRLGIARREVKAFVNRAVS
jgi:RNA polymerase sigma-70 factor (ECF subfamily)